ncbi:diguanylate cyclase, partial [Bacillus thuringiensis]|nr:diguanylate cyclase [Bacillus thuringiensis]
MKTYIVRRLLQMIPTLLGTSIIIFVLFALLPGDYI